MREIVAKALEYLDGGEGWSVIPIHPDTKKPCVEWKEFQDRHATEEEVIDWFDRWPDAQLAVVTGAISGVVIVDCDSEEALRASIAEEMQSPISVQTKRGRHYYFAHPLDGKRRGPRAGSNVRESNPDWPAVKGLDFRGDGSYALLPPSPGYVWDVPRHYDMDDMPTWRDWSPPSPIPSDNISFSDLDLSKIQGMNLDEYPSEWDRTAKYAADKYPATKKLPTGEGNARNPRVARFAGECVVSGLWGDQLRIRVQEFMDEFFEEPLPSREFEATCRAIEEAERRNHPDRFDEHGNYMSPRLQRRLEREKEVSSPSLIQMKDVDRLLDEAGEVDYLIEPWLPKPSIVQVYGYSGSGKSLFVQHCVSALTCGAVCIGPFEVMRKARVLYLDYENGKGTIARRLKNMRELYGDAEDRLNIWAPFEGWPEMNLRTREGLEILKRLISMAKPDVVVIDTIRTAFPGLEENSAQEWSRINSLAIRLRNFGISVIMLHHSNKPTDGPGREAGSSNQLTPLETQIRVAQVYENEEEAKRKGGLWDSDYGDGRVWPRLESKLKHGERLLMVLEISYGKVRDWTDLHEPVQWLGLAERRDGTQFIVSSSSLKQKIQQMARDGASPEDIASAMRRPLRFIHEVLRVLH